VAVSGQPARLHLFDTHSHFFSADFVRYPIDTSASPEGDAKLRARIQATPSTPENILRLWDEQSVQGGVGVQYNSAYRTDNRYLLDVADAHPERIAAVVILDPQGADTPARLRQLAAEHHISGVRFTGFKAADGSYPWLDGPKTVPTWAEAERLHVAVELMYLLPGAQTEALERIGRLAGRFPRINIVLDHFGWPVEANAPDFGLTPAHAALARHKNIYYKFTSINLDRLQAANVSTSSFLRHAVDVYGADHIMWGSDYGNTQETFPAMVARAMTAATELAPVERRQVFNETGRRILGRR
jgi:L-fuconolactonase